jgi:cyclopropane-fatty-acyl-phospholipid synthase
MIGEEFMSSESSAARLVRTIVKTVAPGFAVELWNGERIGPAGGPSVKINDPSAVRQLALKPSLNTFVELWIAKAIDIENGTLFDIAETPLQGRFKDKLKSLPKWKLLRDIPGLIMGSGKKAESGQGGKDPHRSGSDQDAIMHHYDVSNAFYALFLDERMVYTCAYFQNPGDSLDAAQEAKLDLVCRKLRLKPGESLLDIGCGWGAMLIHAAKHYGVTGHGVTLSEAQTELARARIKAEGLEDKITIHLKSYTQMQGEFDKISSIGMFEHVGLAHHDEYFSAVRRLLKPGGLYMHHSVARRMKKSKKMFGRKSEDQLALFKYIFPGAELDHLGMSIANLESHGFEVHDVEGLRPHYAKTCRFWADRLHANFAAAVAEVGEPKARLWLLYLTGVALAFERGTLHINQTLTSKRLRGVASVPMTRDDLYQQRS